MHAADAEAARWTLFARRNRLPRPAARALVTAVRNGAEADSFVADGALHVFVHLPGRGLRDAVLADLLGGAGFAYDPESDGYRFAHPATSPSAPRR